MTSSGAKNTLSSNVKTTHKLLLSRQRTAFSSSMKLFACEEDSDRKPNSKSSSAGAVKHQLMRVSKKSKSINKGKTLIVK